MAASYSYDADEFVRQLRLGTERSLERARATITDPIVLAGIEAQAACLPAQECFARVHIGLREAGRNDHLIAAVAGCLAGQILLEGLTNSNSPGAFWNVFFEYLHKVVAGHGAIAPSIISVPGTPAGRA